MIYYSSHAREKMVERGISEKEVQKAISLGSKHMQFPDKIEIAYTYFSVVYKKADSGLFIITVKPRW